jgi:hypothetical protein
VQPNTAHIVRGQILTTSQKEIRRVTNSEQKLHRSGMATRQGKTKETSKLLQHQTTVGD